MAPLAPPIAAPSDRTEEARHVARLVGIARRLEPFKQACLTRSLALWWVLRSRGIDSQLRVGVARRGQEILAHAWVAYGEVILNESPEVTDHYQRFERPVA